MARRSTPAPSRDATLTAAQLSSAIARWEKRLAELQSFDAFALNDRSDAAFTSLNARLAESLAQTYPSDTSDYQRHRRQLDIWDGPHNYAYSVPKSEWAPAINQSRDKVSGYVSALIESLRERLADATPVPMPVPEKVTRTDPRRVFVVHGHDNEAKVEVARTIERLGLDATILHEQANRGATLIEKLERHSNSDFAVVLLTPDDEGRIHGEASWRPRARQNVVLELGFFAGKIGRENVCVLYVPGVEIPSDVVGVGWHEPDKSGSWRFSLVAELRAAGFDVDANRLISK